MTETSLQESLGVTIESGKYGRLVVARIRPNQDLISALESVCSENAIGRAVIRGVVGSLVEANLVYGVAPNEQYISIPGPGVEILDVAGEVRGDGSGLYESRLSGTVAATDGKLFAGRFCRSRNLSFVTIEATIQEWLVETTVSETL